VKTPPPISDQTGIPSQDAVETSLEAGVERRSVADWTKMIYNAWSRGADSTLQLARLMSRARQCLRYGSWGRLWRSGTLPFSRRKGQMLVLIGAELGGLNAQNSARLPNSWNTLYFLARLGQTAVEQLIAQGRIGPKLSLREAKSLLRGPPAESEPKNSCSKLMARLARLAALIRAESGSWPVEERRAVRRQILALANEIRDEKNTNGAVACKGQMLAIIGPGTGSPNAQNSARLTASCTRNTLQPMEDKPSLVSIGPLQADQHEHVGHHLSTI
jgi:hypothetical protein